MSFDEEWAELKAAALERQKTAAHMQLNQAPGGSGGSAGGGYHVSASSINGNAHLLLEIAGLLYEGRMDGENATMGRAPRSHTDVSKSLLTFAKYAQNQYDDAVVLLAGLASKLKSAQNTYTTYDKGVQAQLNKVLTTGQYVPPERR